MRLASVPGIQRTGARAVARGFEHLLRLHEAGTGRVSVKILPGEYYATAQDEVITTVLGSCVSACIHDPEARVGGMNHFMLPEPSARRGRWGDTAAGRSARYGSDAMEQLVNTVLKAGGERGRLQVKIFGGGRVLARMTDIGARNVDFVRRYLDAESLLLAAEDVGGERPRQVRFYPVSGRAQVRRLNGLDDVGLADRERRYLKQLANDPIKGEVELF
ncbi:MAG: chemoreceptor glutamine deamidase CheD [Xanthomonadales bacterium]|nr:chemoreceptor glutamine deamidase CheD [Xanthomonadales bacterium]ODU95246.1 MAG: chemotaxis protein CheD [Rhodanobacter sp. SCN 66-43]OJY82974.1 MAG: chemotaxis protein CheD [Xanthomonadales bacterium 66-474]